MTSHSNASEAALYESCEVYGANSLLDVCNHIVGTKPLTATVAQPLPITDNDLDLVDVKGQQLAKRALEISAAGGHNLLLYGPPGTGKTMLASRLPGIMPALTTRQFIEVASIHSLCNHSQPSSTTPPFRHPHHTSSAVALVGGGSQPRPGEISLAHQGILFLDELPEFQRQVLEVLREPMESGDIYISRANAQVRFPANFQLIAAMNPCQCGYFGSTSEKHHCCCTPDQVKRYRQKISGPLLDRIDLHVAVSHASTSELQNLPDGESSVIIKQRVLQVREIQLQRQQKVNAHLTKADIKHYCPLNKNDRSFLNAVVDKLGLSARAYDRILKTARTIADLSKKECIHREHISEAIGYRNFDRSTR